MSGAMGGIGGFGRAGGFQCAGRGQGRDADEGVFLTEFGNSVLQEINTQIMDKIDTDKNGSIDKDEFSNFIKQNRDNGILNTKIDNAFSIIDSNSDNSISVDELLKMIKELSLKDVHEKEHESAKQSVQNVKQDFDSLLTKSILSYCENSGVNSQ